MILYHGSTEEIKKPDLIHSRKNVAFGIGFYTTPIYEQAEKWCERFQRRGHSAIISEYDFDESQINALKIKRFDTYSEEWLDFIVTCRRGNDHSDYDIVMGDTANDKVFNTIELYFSGLIDKNVAIERLQYEKPNMQVCFRTEAALRALQFERSVTL